jgi:chromosome segregation ATPase
VNEGRAVGGQGYSAAVADTQTQIDTMREDIRAISDSAVQALEELKEHSYQFTRVIIRLNLLDARQLGLDSRLNRVEEKVTGLDEKVTGLDQKVTGLDQKVIGLGGQMKQVEARLDLHDARFDQVDAKLAQHDGRFDRVDAQLAEILRRLPAA